MTVIPVWMSACLLPIIDHPETPRHMLTSTEITRREDAGIPIRTVSFHATRGDGSVIVMMDPEYRIEIQYLMGWLLRAKLVHKLIMPAPEGASMAPGQKMVVEELYDLLERVRILEKEKKELLAALERLSAWGRMDEPSTSANLASIIHDANAAIAKAEGDKNGKA